jgi:uncharacterized OsmC-like protein
MSDPQPSWALVSVRIKSDDAASSTVFARRHHFTVGRPITFDREDPEVSAMEYLAGAVAADVVGTFRKVARERRIAIDDIEAVAQGQLNNALTFIGVIGEDGDPALKVLSLKVYISTGSPEAVVRTAWAAALTRSPLYTTLKNSIDLPTELQILH